MADYIYLLEHRLSSAQQAALEVIRTVARAHALTVFLVGGAVRDLTSGSPVRDLDVAVQGNALKLRKELELSGGVITGEYTAGQALFVRFAGGVRIEIGSTLSVTYPKPGKPLAAASTILEDLRRRDFTANAMALSLNDGSYGLLMDPLNGVADIENRELRLVSNYGFIEDPVRMIRAARFAARLGWAMEEKTQARYETGKQENYIAALGDFHRGYETEEIFHEEDPLRILRKLEAEGWMKSLFPGLTVAKANAVELDKLREVQTQLQMRGIHPEAAAANFPLLTAKLAAKEIAELKSSFARPGFVKEIESLEAEAKEVATLLTGKGAATPSQAWKLLVSAKPESVLWVAYSTKSNAIQTKLKSFFTEWPQARNKIPYTLMQEMRIVPELADFDEIVEKLFYELMDGSLGTVEEMKAFLETYSPPAPPPPVHMRRARAAKKDAKGAKGRKKAAAAVEDDDEDRDDRHQRDNRDEDDDTDNDDDRGTKIAAADDADESEEAEPEETAPTAAPAKPAPAPKVAAAKPSAPKPAAAPKPPVPAKPVPPVKAAPPAAIALKPAVGVKVAAKAAAKSAPPAKVVAKKAVAPPPSRKTAAAKRPVAAPKKAVPAKKLPAKAASKKVPARSIPAKKTAPRAVPAKATKAPAKRVVPVKLAAAKKPAVAPARKLASKAPVKSVPAKKTAAKKSAPKKRR